jgi:hypothetical protein
LFGKIDVVIKISHGIDLTTVFPLLPGKRRCDMELNRLYGVWQVDLTMPCPFGIGLGQGFSFQKSKN